MRSLFLRLLAVFRSGRAEADLAREINAHLQLIEDDLVARGATPAEARMAARRSFGGVEQAKEHQRDARSFRWIDDSRSDFKLGARMLVKYPGLSAIGGIGLAVAIAIGAAFFTFFHAYLSSTLPVEDGDRIVALENWDVKANNEARRSLHDFISWRDGMRSMEEIGAFRITNRNLIANGAASPVRVAEMTAAGFRVTRVSPLIGRTFEDADEAEGAAGVLVIGFDAWHTTFGGDRSVIGREVRLGNTPHTIIGVMPKGYAFPINDSYWTPLHVEPAAVARGEGPELFVFGRLAGGVTVDQAQAELATFGARAAEQFPTTNAQLQPRVLPYAYPILDIQDISLWQVSLMQATVSLLLVIVAINVSILIYARTATRQGEIAVRTALGASRRRIVGQLFTEALVLCGGAAVVGIVLARIGVAQAHGIMAAEGSTIPYWIDQRMPIAAYFYVAGLVVVAAVIAGVLPALHATGRRVQLTMKQAAGSSGLRLGTTWTVLIVTQVALAVAGLPIAVASGWSEISTSMTAPAFNDRSFLAARISADPDAPPLRTAAVNRDIVERITREPAVSDATRAAAAPGDEPSALIEVEGMQKPASGATTVGVNQVATDFFDAFGIGVAAGRNLTAADAVDEASPVVVNRAFARALFGGGNPVGRRIRVIGTGNDAGGSIDRAPWTEIVGVVDDLFTNPIDPELVRPVMFHALPDDFADPAFLLVRTRGRDASAFAPRLREITTTIDPTLRLVVRSYEELQRQQSLAVRLVLFALALVIGSVLLLSAAGIYALMSFAVAQRRKEIGIRAAMGADASQLLRSIFSRAAVQLGLGVLAGLAVAELIDAASGGEALGSWGRLLLPATSLTMVVVGLLAAIGPARTGLRIQPTEALRSE